jgi:hypothetical protein
MAMQRGLDVLKMFEMDWEVVSEGGTVLGAGAELDDTEGVSMKYNINYIKSQSKGSMHSLRDLIRYVFSEWNTNVFDTTLVNLSFVRYDSPPPDRIDCTGNVKKISRCIASNCIGFASSIAGTEIAIDDLLSDTFCNGRAGDLLTTTCDSSSCDWWSKTTLRYPLNFISYIFGNVALKSVAGTCDSVMRIINASTFSDMCFIGTDGKY